MKQEARSQTPMAIHVALHHLTRYDYDRPVHLGPHLVRLRPAAHARTPVSAYSIRVRPEPHFVNWQQDPYGNFVARYVFPEPVQLLSVEVDLVADMTIINPFDFFVENEAKLFPFAYAPDLRDDLRPYLAVPPATPRLAAWVESIDRGPTDTVTFLVDLNQKLQRHVGYVIRMEPGVQTPEETLALGRGSCRDSAWLLVHVLRHLGLAARFVSGYLIQLRADEKPRQGPSGPEHDFTDLHAWTEVFVPGAGWLGLDPTSGLFAGEGHIPLAATPSPAHAAPIEGAVDECGVGFAFDMNVTRVRETPRVTLPYTEETWGRVLAVGEQVERSLATQDVRLTMGGEPTFVAAADPDGAEWNTDALGPTKRAYAGRLLRNLARRFAHAPLLHYGQGKWYPGEQLPRWALGCYFRHDGEPIWSRPELLASDDDRHDALRGDDGVVQAERFARRLCAALGLSQESPIAGYEDTWYYLWRERRLPVNVEPTASQLADPLERERLARVFEHGLENAVGYAIPIGREGVGSSRRWVTGHWFVRPERMYLVPGDSPMGYRLPLDSLPWVVEEDYPFHLDRDPFAPRPALPARRVLDARFAPRDRVLSGEGEEAPPAVGESDPTVVRTAMCVEPREGLLHVFMPPLALAEDYLELVAALEATAAELGQAVMIEGYPPPSDPRLQHFTVTPDPGVIEVNIHPSAHWEELIDRTTQLYEAASEEGLCAEKFMLDGRHVGTGGGNHFVLGGQRASDSPLLRRPDLLKSLLSYWNNHPSLSYLFSGLFIGPTSQHPRVDEARNDSLYELEIALSRLGRGMDAPPWLVDRVLRNLLVDVTGNTHRTEMCIDKLYAPESIEGRRGLLELRAFEMPPHARMSVAQQLLLRALIARFWQTPYESGLVRWGTRLHDDFMLSSFVWQDFLDVLDDLRASGFAFDSSFFDPHMEFRFPRLGGLNVRGVEIELRQALEPWHVLGEEPSGGGVARFVDSSVERVEVKARGLVPERYVLSCNGHALPLRPLGVPGDFVSAVRFKAWAPPRGLHPTLPTSTPLVVDLFDRWTGRSLGGCSYHVAHPAGRNYERFPVNAFEAEARRRARFFAMNHTPGPTPPPTGMVRSDLPTTLDLRRAADPGR